MSWAARLFWGIALGGLFALTLHPVSRPFLWLTPNHWGPSNAIRNSPWLPENLRVLPEPTDAMRASLWMQAGAERIRSDRTITASDIQKLYEVAELVSKEDTGNAFWDQMEAVFAAKLRKSKESDAAWLTASKAERWNDYQTARLIRVQLLLAQEQGTTQAWQFAAVYPLRSIAAADLIAVYGQSRIAKQSLETREGLLLRFASLQNGRLVRDFSRSLAVGEIGAKLVETSGYRLIVGNPRSPRRLLLSRFEYINHLKAFGLEAEATQTDRAYRSNEGWLALTPRTEETSDHIGYALGSVVASTLPSALLWCTVCGIALWFVGWLLENKAWAQKLYHYPIPTIVGGILAVLIYWLTGLVLAALVAGLSCSFQSFTPIRERSRPPQYLGPLFRFIIVLLAIAFCVLMCGFFIGISRPGFEVLPRIGLPTNFVGGSSALLGLAGLVLSLLLLIAPSFAIAIRMTTVRVGAIALREFGGGIAITCMLLCILLTPAAVYADDWLQQPLRMMVENEPVYYLQQ